MAITSRTERSVRRARSLICVGPLARSTRVTALSGRGGSAVDGRCEVDGAEALLVACTRFSDGAHAIISQRSAGEEISRARRSAMRCRQPNESSSVTRPGQAKTRR